MAIKKKTKRRKTDRSRVLALALVGSGLLIIGAVALIMLPKPGASPQAGGVRSAIPVAVEFPAPELALKDLQGKEVSLEDYRGQVVLVNNWATWCPPCKAEMPTLQAYYDAHRDQGFTIVAVEAGGPLFEVNDFVSRASLTFPIWTDPDNQSLVAFRNQSLPNSYLIDRDGTVRLAWTGAISRDMLEQHVTPILED
jgi:cytochrome c biogenesis protein CcmG/thiol:disulfide interchange protein DsbE